MAIIRKYRAKVVTMRSLLPEIYLLELKSTDKTFQYFPGQFLHLAIDEGYDGIGQWPESRCFSMQSSPDEDTIRITFAVKGRFTNNMVQKISVGSELWLKLPYGNLFHRPHSKVKTVFIAGGTGITPFLSLFKHNYFTHYIDPVIYLGFRSRRYNFYEDDIERIKNNSSKIRYYYQDQDGSLDIQNIFAQNPIDSSYFISGPPDMIKSFEIFLRSNGVHSSNVLTDDWE